MRRTKRWLTLSLAALLLFGGCSQIPKENTPTLSLYMNISTTDADALTMVSEALDDYVYQKLGFHVQLHTPTNYTQTLKDDLRKGEQIDVAMVPSSIQQLATDGLLRPLDDLLETNGLGILDNINEAYLEDARIDGVLYTFPTNRDRHTSYGFAYNQEIADQYGLDLSGVDSLEDLTPIFAELKASAPDISPFVVTSPTVLYGVMDSLSDRCGVLMFDDISTVVNLYETENFETIIRLIYQWNQAGYLLDQTKESKSYTYYLGSGRVFGGLVQGHVMFAAQESKFGESAVSYIPLTPACYNSSNASRLGYAIPTASAYPEQDMALLNLLYTDTYVANLLMYGIEGVHYTRSEDDPSVLCYPDIQTPEHYTGMNPWKYCNQYIADRWDVYDPDYRERVEEANLTAVRSPAVGFTFDTTAVSRQYQNCIDTVNEYLPVLQAGIVDPDELLPEFQQALRDAGIEEVIAEKQRQLDAFILKSK